MNENVSRLMDGECDDVEFERFCAELKSEEALHAWLSYHVIGDHLRGARGFSPAFGARFAAALAAEPTVLAPEPAKTARTPPATYAWAVAATLAAVTVVGWTAFSMIDVPPNTIAKAREAASVRAASVTRPPGVPTDYLLAHQEYSPATTIQGVGPYLRAVATDPQSPSETRAPR